MTVRDRRFFYGSTFTPGALPQRQAGEDDACVGAALSVDEATVFLDYISSGLLSEARKQGVCGGCWAYAISACIQYATSLAYERKGGMFDSRYMAPQLLLSCMEIEDVACGCFGGDLAGAMAQVAKSGMVTFRQFPYENDSSVSTRDGQVHYICEANEGAGGYLGTCAPCRRGESMQGTVVTDVLGVATANTAFVTLASCVPCGSAGAPFFFPVRPCRLFVAEESLDLNVMAVKRAIRAHGPVCATIKINSSDFSRLGSSGLLALADVLTAPVYAPKTVPPSGALHSVLIVGYVDPWTRSGLQTDRARSVFVCRNSWGEDWGFRVRSVGRVQEADGTQRLAPREFGGFFCISMYEETTNTGLLRTSIGLQGIQIRTLGDASPRQLLLTDPFVAPFSSGFADQLMRAASPERPESLETPSSPLGTVQKSRGRVLAVLAILALLVLVGGFFVFRKAS